MRWPALRHPARPPLLRSEPATAPAVLLVHGLWRTPLSFLPLVRRLRQWEFRPEQFGYAAFAERYDAITERLVHRLRRLAGAGAPYVLLGHSLGGLLLRSALARLEGIPPAHLIMLGTPNRTPRLARALGVHWVYRRLLGECGIRLTSVGFYAGLPIPRVPYTIVAGTGGPRGRWSPFGDELNDGLVAVSETPIRDEDPLVLLPVTHTFMMNDTGVQAVIREVLARVPALP